MRGGPTPRPAAERFWVKVEKTTTCWLWIAYLDKKGYGQFYVSRDRGRAYAHVWSYEQVNGSVPEGLELDHLCKNPACVRPAHLEAVTHAENVRRSKSSTKTHCPKNHPYEERSRQKNGKRRCHTCHREREQARYEPRRAARH